MNTCIQSAPDVTSKTANGSLQVQSLTPHKTQTTSPHTKHKPLQISAHEWVSCEAGDSVQPVTNTSDIWQSLLLKYGSSDPVNNVSTVERAFHQTYC